MVGNRRATPVGLEVGSKRVFAWAPEWPGWCRAGRSEDLALETLAAYAPRYAQVPDLAGIRFRAGAADTFVVDERIEGNATTDFGAPGGVADSDSQPVTKVAAARQAALVAAAWSVLDRVAAAAPAELRKGPRGGGRDRDKMLAHVLAAEAAYARKLGIKHKEPALDDSAAIAALRRELIALLGAPSDGSPPVANGWPSRYGARRIAWHVLDHAWEMQDRG